MRALKKTSDKIQYGDFQTPPELVQATCKLLSRMGLEPSSIVEPSCGKGAFLMEALARFREVRAAFALDIDLQHVKTTLSSLARWKQKKRARVSVQHDDFFRIDWPGVLDDLPEPVLVIGNPPWVTNAELGALGSSNLPRKTNLHQVTGLEAKTGKGNFDISESMILHLLRCLDGKDGAIAMLCKTQVARKVLAYAWKHRLSIHKSELYRIDAGRFFAAAVEACLLVCRLPATDSKRECSLYENLDSRKSVARFGYRDDVLIADLRAYERWKHLRSDGAHRWRSGIKHDCAKVMELLPEGRKYRNKLGELVSLEPRALYPMLKSSDLNVGSPAVPRRRMLVTQKSTAQDPIHLKKEAPKTWNYLVTHADLLDRRGSSIYQKRPRFSSFGVGEYSFTPWKVAISGFYKRLEFRVIGPYRKKPTVLDDTCYFIACQSQKEATHLASLLNSPIAQEFLGAFIFWDSKRPITIEVLRRLNLTALQKELSADR
jgi:hypothetical protein